MKNIEDILKRAGKAVAAVFAAFGGFLTQTQPPEGVLKGFSVGFASTLSALLFLVISVIAKEKFPQKHRRLFIIFSGLLVLGVAITGLGYQRSFAQLTLPLPTKSGTERIVIGTALTPAAASQLQKPGESLTQLVLDFGGKDNRELVWTRNSINASILKLNNNYIALAVFVAAAVFCLAEVLFPARTSENRR